MTEQAFTALLYKSKALTPIESGSDLDIVSEAVRFNGQHGITGFLVRCSDHYIQAIEGDPELIDVLWKKIQKDPRHDDSELLWTGSYQQRKFPAWAMSYADFEDLLDADFAQKVLAGPVGDPDLVIEILDNFRKAILSKINQGTLVH